MRYKQAKLVQSKITSTKGWVEKISRLLSLPVAEKFVENNMVEDNSFFIMAYGGKKDVVSKHSFFEFSEAGAKKFHFKKYLLSNTNFLLVK